MPLRLICRVVQAYIECSRPTAQLLYVGKAASLRDRVGSYFQRRHWRRRSRRWCRQIRAWRSRSPTSETEALLLEYNLIKEHRPRFNVMLRDDKSFPYIQLTPLTPIRG